MTHAPPRNRLTRNAALPSARHWDVDDRAVLDFLRGDYIPAAGSRPQRSEAPTVPPLSGLPGYCANTEPAYAIVEYDRTSRVHWVVGPFGDALSAEHWAIDAGLARYDVVSATPIARERF
jgi:hypothetical protein